MPPERLVLVHGFTQTARSWDGIRARLGPRYDVVAVDAPGHGDSPVSDESDLWQSADAIVAAGGRGTYAGYSMGARICLHAALAHPGAVARLVLVSATAGIDDPRDRAERRRADEALAVTIERDGVDAFLHRWLAQPLFATLPAEARGLDDRRRNTAAGLAASLRHAGTGTQEPLWDRLGELAMPVLVMAGSRDAKFVALAARLAELIPGAEMAVVPDAGHTVHLERPEAFVQLLTAWLAHLPPPP